MSNRQSYPNSVFPLTGDVTSDTGASEVTVTGIQDTDVSAQPPQNGQLLIYDGPTAQYVPGDPIVSGPDKPGTKPTVNPVQVAGIDEGNLVRELRTDGYGSLRAQRLEELMSQNIAVCKALLAAFVEANNLPDSDYDPDNFTQENN